RGTARHLEHPVVHRERSGDPRRAAPRPVRLGHRAGKGQGMNIGYLGAFLGGALSLLSPCSALLVPAFFAYAFADRVRLLMRTGVFFLGLATTLVPMGVAAGSIGALFNEYRDLVVLIGGLLMIGLGIAQIVGFGFGSGAEQRLSGR